MAQGTQIVPEGTVHLESPDKDIKKQSITLGILQKMITDAEISTKKLAIKHAKPGQDSFVSDRIILTDSCMGSDQYEHDQLGEGSIICLLGISKDPAELPFAKVYFEGKDGKTFDLLQVATLPVKAAHSLKTDGSLGRNIWAALYWVPKVRTLSGQLLVDFKVNRTRFRPGIDFPFPVSFGEGLKDKGSKELTINLGTIKEVVEREYPGMVIEPAILEGIKSLSKS
jgi:hypothetical protein